MTTALRAGFGYSASANPTCRELISGAGLVREVVRWFGLR